MSSVTRKKLEARVDEATRTLGQALEDLRAYDDASRLVWRDVSTRDFATTLTESQLEQLLGDDEVSLHSLSQHFDALREALLRSGIAQPAD